MLRALKERKRMMRSECKRTWCPTLPTKAHPPPQGSSSLSPDHWPNTQLVKVHLRPPLGGFPGQLCQLSGHQPACPPRWRPFAATHSLPRISVHPKAALGHLICLAEMLVIHTVSAKKIAPGEKKMSYKNHPNFFPK